MSTIAAKARSRRLAALEGLETRKKLRESVSGILPQSNSSDVMFKSGRSEENIFVI